MNREQFVEWAVRNGWVLDKWGHLQKSRENCEYRLKLAATYVRYETKLGSVGWIRLRGAYYRNLRLTDAKLVGLGSASRS